MLVSDFDYQLPAELIAQEPLVERASSRLMTVDRRTSAIGEEAFSILPGLLQPDDILVVNDTRVIPARLKGIKETGGQVEVFLVRRAKQPGEVWHCLMRSSKKPQSGTVITFAGGMTATVAGRGDGECWMVEFESAERFPEWLERAGAIPLPPYIKRAEAASDRERYQTVFARESGAVAAPTAGLHFTPELLKKIVDRGVEIVPLTLHVGLGTFLPLRVADVREHRMHREQFHIPDAAARAVADCKRRGGRVVAVGTTVVRTLEQAAAGGVEAAGEGEADIFIYPGYRFKVVDAMVTNFHLPQSTLLMLVSAFAGKDLLLAAYQEAIQRRFRFFSYGDAMFIS